MLVLVCLVGVDNLMRCERMNREHLGILMAQVHLYLLLVDVPRLFSNEGRPSVHLIRGAAICRLALGDLVGLGLSGLAGSLQSLSRRRPLAFEPIIEEHEHGLLIDYFLVTQLEQEPLVSFLPPRHRFLGVR